ncbi:hypothetical protein L211DRAFT_858560 [Terfezia boudieri ATCC MYA-4762]|uniref:P-loop containing nucleoside triphosphate hydrolase protein n=1 Tax=Terfezia boudieri ATCC MYA-4762 TaxID=1051890 RepID=A0A3N4LK21_9PEZI|nr:hypothetical protein L211DRAFT_858560 [Terfezia boudieri ATCC MYA-4762]
MLLDEEYSERTKTLIPQYGLLGSIQAKVQDTRIFLNSNNPASFFICGLQGSGKSHTLSTLLENYLIPSPKIGVLRKPLSGLVLHFGEFNSRDAFRPCEAAYLASPDGKFAGGRTVQGVTVLVSPSNYLNLKIAYGAIPGVSVRQLKLRSRDLTIQSMLTLMSVDSTSSQPLYMAQVTKVLRDMAAVGNDFDYISFTQRLADVDLIPGQRRMLDQRLELLESFLDLECFDGGCFEDIRAGQQLIIVDLSCPFVDASAACVLFNICIGLFLAATSPEKLGKVIAVDEAHKYMTDTPASKILTEQLLSIIRQQRHFAARIIIATQEPTISPRLMDLASATIIHRFSSPEWFNILRQHLSIVNSGGKEAADLFTRITSLRLGEALVFAPSAILTVSADEFGPESSGSPDAGLWEGIAMLQGAMGKGLGTSNTKRMMSEFFKMKVRRRITADGGATIRSV